MGETKMFNALVELLLLKEQRYEHKAIYLISKIYYSLFFTEKKNTL